MKGSGGSRLPCDSADLLGCVIPIPALPSQAARGQVLGVAGVREGVAGAQAAKVVWDLVGKRPKCQREKLGFTIKTPDQACPRGAVAGGSAVGALEWAHWWQRHHQDVIVRVCERGRRKLWCGRKGHVSEADLGSTGRAGAGW